MPTFAEFYEAVHGFPPFPWQVRLAALAADAAWPSEIGVPTGLGKTSCLDIAVWALAAQAERAATERTAPTRIWWLVNRRLLVDSTANHADRLADLLATAEASSGDPSQRALAEVAGRLRLLSPDGRVPLEVVRLRGALGHAGPAPWHGGPGRPSTPSQPAVILSTLPMYGSRLLFQGYGVSTSMRPVDAAMAGTDSLVLIDEAHLARSLVALFPPLADCDRPTVPVMPGRRSRPIPVTLTATGSATDPARFDLDDTDLDHPVISQRLSARKPMRIVVGEPSVNQVPLMVSAAMSVIGASPQPTSMVVFANTPRIARQLFAELTKALGKDPAADVLLLTGRMREREGAAVRAAVVDPVDGVPARPVPTARRRHLVVVATQTLEVGADLDFEHLVTEACGSRALVQRLGRLNRLGLHPHASATYVHVTPKAVGNNEPRWPVYASEPLGVLERLQAAAVDGVVEVGPITVRRTLGPPLDAPGYTPQVLPALLWEWAKTTTPPDGAAPVEPYFSGLDAPDLSAEICWRCHLPETGGQLWPRLNQSETIEVPVYELVDALGDRHVLRLRRDRLTVEEIEPGEIRPGDVVLLPVDAGLHDDYGWAPEASTGTVADMSVPSRGIPLDSDALTRLVGPGPWRTMVRSITEPSDDADPDDIADAVSNLVEALAAAEPTAHAPAEWAEAIAQLETSVRFPAGSVPYLGVTRRSEESLSDDLDELSLAAVVSLALHGEGVGRYAQRIAERIGMSPTTARSVALAAAWHDIGKADRRFQQWLDPAAVAAGLVAKSGRDRSLWQRDRIASGWPAGGRHEALSGRLVSAALSGSASAAEEVDVDLVIHLVISHHGHGRPLLCGVPDEPTATVTAEVDSMTITVSADLSAVDWDQPTRFKTLCDRYGLWGLALLEAAVRQADHMVTAGSVDWSVV